MNEDRSSSQAGLSVPDIVLILASLSAHCSDEKFMHLRSRYFCMSSFKTGEKTPVWVFSLARLNEVRLLQGVMQDEGNFSCVELIGHDPLPLGFSSCCQITALPLYK